VCLVLYLVGINVLSVMHVQGWGQMQMQVSVWRHGNLKMHMLGQHRMLLFFLLETDAARRLLVPQRSEPTRGENVTSASVHVPRGLSLPSTRKSNVAGLGKWGHVDQVPFGPFLQSCRQPRRAEAGTFPGCESWSRWNVNCQCENTGTCYIGISFLSA